MNNQDPNGGRSCIQLLSLVAFMWGAAMMFPKTVDLLSKFSPNEFMGYTDMAGWWAMGSALLIEGVMVIMKIKTWISPARNLVEWLWDIVLTVAPFVLSSFAQIFDGMIVRDTLAQEPEQIQMLVTWLVPGLPSIMIGLLIAFALIESAPAGIFGGMRVGNAGGIRWPSVGNPFNALRDWWHKGRKPANTGGEPKSNPTPPPPPRGPRPR
jgi:hypothetical protein